MANNDNDICVCGHKRIDHHNRSEQCRECAFVFGIKTVTRCPKFRKKPKPRQRVNPVSKRRIAANRIYSRLKREYLEEHPVCQVRWCRLRSNQIHHMKKPRAKYLNDTDTFLATCHYCHTKIELNKTWAREQGYLENI